MSYLSIPRIAFAGRFQSDVSTVNNDVRHFDIASFEPRFQEPAVSQTEMNGWWNPRGTGAFRLVDVRIRQSVTAAGQDGSGDPATGLHLSAQVERTAAKMVDLDPQFQMGSSLWGLRLILTDGMTEYMRGDYLAAPFRDLFFGRVNRGPGSGNASAKYTSVLENVEWGPEAGNSPVLAALMQASQANEGRLSANLVTYGYVSNATSPDFTYGNLVGSIGTWEVGSPRKFVQGRRFAPVLSQSTGPFANSSNIGFFDAEVTGAMVSLDLSNALPLADTSGTMGDIGALHLALLTAADTIEAGKITPGATEGSKVDSMDLVDFGPIGYCAAGWLTGTAGLGDLPVPEAALSLIKSHPLALVTPDTDGTTATIRIRETYAGLMLRADTMELRVDAEPRGKVARQTTLYATQYGTPVKDLPVTLTLNPPEAGQGSSGETNPPNVKAPAAPIPDIGTPPGAVTIAPPGQTDAEGRLEVNLGFTAPGNPRGYIDGQIYKVNYGVGYEGTSAVPLFEQVVIHLRDAYTPPATPDWDNDIAPILVQYGNLYPIMSHGLFSFSDEAVVRVHARILAFALSRDIADPTHMPATRDLSEGKRKAILDWLQAIIGEDVPKAAAPPPDHTTALQGIPDAPAPVAEHATVPEDIPETVAKGFDGKTAAVREMIAARIHSRSGER